MTASPAAPASSAVRSASADNPPSATRRVRRLRWRRIVAVVALLMAGIVAKFGPGWRDRYLTPRNWATVEPGRLYRSGQVSRQLVKPTLAANKIKSIVFMSEDKANRPDVEAERAAAAELGIERHNFPLGGDGVGNPIRYADAIEVIARCDKAGKPVLVHCHTGAQRTGGTIALYRVLVQGRPGRDAYAELLAHGHDPRENPKLVPFINQRMPEIARALADRGVIPTVPATMPVVGP